MFTMFVRGRTDLPLALANDAVGYALAKQHAPANEIVAAEEAASEDTYYIGFSKKSSARQLISIINKVISDLREEGVIEKIIRGKQGACKGSGHGANAWRGSLAVTSSYSVFVSNTAVPRCDLVR